MHTLVLDLDETLLHTDQATQETLQRFKRQPDYRVSGMVGWLRPHSKEFLRWAFKNFNIIVWTAGSREYAEVVVPELFTKQGLPMPQKVLAAENCVPRLENTGWYSYAKCRYKPLPKLWKRGLNHRNTLIIDDRSDTASDNMENLLLIPTFERDDQYLRKLKDWLEANSAATLGDLSKLDKTTWWLE